MPVLDPPTSMSMTPISPARRQLLASALGLGSGLVNMRCADAADLPDDLVAAIAAFTKGAPLREGRVVLEIAQLVDNGNAVPLTVTVASPMTAADHVTAIAVFNERNPQRDVIKVQLGPRAGRAQLSTRIRLATAQKIVAVARLSDGSCWSRTADVVVTLAACIEETS